MKAKHDHKNCRQKLTQKMQEICLKRGLNLTPIRQKVLDIIAASHKALKAYDILAILREEGFSDKPPTIYRALDFLIESGVVYKLNRVNAYVASFSDKKKNIACFLICSKCLEVKEHEDKTLIAKIANIVKDKKNKNLGLEIEFDCEKC